MPCVSSCRSVRSRYRLMATEHVRVPTHAADWATPSPEPVPTWTPAPALERPRTPVNEGLIEVASSMAPGKACLLYTSDAADESSSV